MIYDVDTNDYLDEVFYYSTQGHYNFLYPNPDSFEYTCDYYIGVKPTPFHAMGSEFKPYQVVSNLESGIDLPKLIWIRRPPQC